MNGQVTITTHGLFHTAHEQNRKEPTNNFVGSLSFI